MRTVLFLLATFVGLSFGIGEAAANKITVEQAEGACKGSRDGNGDIACTKCGTINDRTCKYVVVYQCEGKNCTTTVYRKGRPGYSKHLRDVSKATLRTAPTR